MSDWVLDDVEAVSRKHPDSFFIPTEQERRNRIVGDLVQLHFVIMNPKPDQPRAERMWVEITKVEPNGTGYQGHLANQPQVISGLNAGDIIQFEAKHIAKRLVQRGDSLWLDCGEQSAFVSKKVFEGEKTARFAYREKPDNDRDSGWRLLEGSEPDDYTGNPNNIRLCNIYWLVDFDPTLHQLFEHEVGSAFERRNKDNSWRQVKGWHANKE